MKKLSIMLAVLILFNSVLISNASAVEVKSENEAGEEMQEVVISGEVYAFYKDGMEYKVRYEDGTVSVWAYDVLLSTEVEYMASASSSSSWVYLRTDIYVTYINY